MMKKIWIVMALAFGILVPWADQSANGATYYYSGTVCTPDSHGTQWDVVAQGLANPNGSSASVYECPITGHTILSGTAITGYGVRYDDQNAGAGQQVYGYLVAVSSTSVIWSSGTRYSCTTAPSTGCTSASGTDTYSGNGNLVWSNPISSSATNLANIYGLVRLPAKSGATGWSVVEHVSITY